jgi:hypothetical protein
MTRDTERWQHFGTVNGSLARVPTPNPINLCQQLVCVKDMRAALEFTVALLHVLGTFWTCSATSSAHSGHTSKKTMKNPRNL